jgi:hypothetical protein
VIESRNDVWRRNIAFLNTGLNLTGIQLISLGKNSGLVFKDEKDLVEVWMLESQTFGLVFKGEN